jgi:pyruvate,orthophosphate dikinase
MFGNVVMGLDNNDFEHRITALKKVNGLTFDNELTADLTIIGKAFILAVFS